MVKKTFQVVGMHCPSCSLMIESDLEDIGVKAACHYAGETLDVEFDETKITEEKIRKTVRSSGYDIA